MQSFEPLQFYKNPPSGVCGGSSDLKENWFLFVNTKNIHGTFFETLSFL